MQFVSEFDYEYAYNMFLIEEEYNEAMHKFQTETLLLNEGNLGTLMSNLREFIEKIVNGIKNALSKFKETMGDIFMKDKDYLKKYKSIVEKNPVLNAKFNHYYHYNIAKLRSSKLPKLQVEDLAKLEGDQEKLKKLFPDFVPTSEEQSFSDRVKEVFRGGEAKTIEADQVKLEELYAFCVTYDDLIKEIEKDIGTIDDANLIVRTKFKMIKHSGATGVYKTKQEESFDYSKTMQYYFNEVEIATDEKDKEENKETVDKVNGQENNNSSGGTATVEEDPDTTNSEDEAKKKEAAATKLYYKLCGEFLGIRFAMASECYKQCMKIIKWHVSQYKKDTSDQEDDNNSNNLTNSSNSNNTENKGNTDNTENKDNTDNNTNSSDNKNIENNGNSENNEVKPKKSFLARFKKKKEKVKNADNGKKKKDRGLLRRKRKEANQQNKE